MESQSNSSIPWFNNLGHRRRDTPRLVLEFFEANCITEKDRIGSLYYQEDNEVFSVEIPAEIDALKV